MRKRLYNFLCMPTTAAPAAAEDGPGAISAREWGAVVACLVLFLALRTPFIGHILFWDEAMNICTTRSFAAGGHDTYSDWFWRHPPLYLLSLLSLHPLDAGFIDRAQALTVAFWSASFVLLYRLNRLALGRGVALVSIFCLAIMPGARFFDVWIKQECLVVFFGLAALLAWEKKQRILTGVWLGLALLSKEFGIFFAGVVFLAWLVSPRRERRWRELCLTAAVTVVIAGWWYCFFSTSGRGYLAFATGLPVANNLDEVEAYRRPWYFYLQSLVTDLGWDGALLATAGLVQLTLTSLAAARNSRATASTAWPLFLLVCAAPVLQLAAGKAPWFCMVLYVAFATLQAIAVLRLWELVGNSHQGRQRLALLGLCALVVGILISNARVAYDDLFARHLTRDCATTARVAREAAMLLAAVTEPGDRILITPSRWYNEPINFIDPALVPYTPPGLNVLPAGSRKIPFDTLVTIIREAELHAVVLSLDPETEGVPIFVNFRRQFGLLPLMAGNGDYLVYRTSTLWQKHD